MSGNALRAGWCKARQPIRAIRDCHLEKSYPIEALCKLLSVSRSAYYKWAAGIPSKRAQENAAIAEKIEKIHADSPDKGYRRINSQIAELTHLRELSMKISSSRLEEHIDHNAPQEAPFAKWV